ncbi:MAG: hypothetical protein QOD43_938, partial [Gaiellaceae bacterium]|nr:hypothetical protein [Gaiellaceae bacterium]
MAEWVCGSCNGANPEGTRFCGNCGAKAPDSSPAPEERRLITALFADISGFTPLAGRLDPEELLEVIDPIVSALSSIVGRYEGFVEKFAGDALLALFGAPVSHDDDAARALLVALEMHAELERLKAHLPPDARDLTLHVGINSGHGIARMIGSEARTDYAVLGDAVILAQRLESAAPPGETYVSEMTVRLTESEFTFEPVGELTLKGKAEPVPAWRLVGVQRTRRPATNGSLIGRDKELAQIDELLVKLGSGDGAVVAVTGEPGIGKSRLTEALLSSAAGTGARLLHARCLSYGAGLPYWPYADLVRRTIELSADHSPEASQARLADAVEAAGVRQVEPFLARLLGLPVEDDLVERLEPEAFRRGLHDAFPVWLTAHTGDAPIVLAIEDIHWADASSLELTAELCELTTSIPLMVVLVGRPEAAEQLDHIANHIELRRIELAPFGADAIAELTAGLLGAAAPDALVRFVERRTSGNPFFVQELVRALRERGALVLADGQWTIRPGWDERELPATIEGVLTGRIDLLPRASATLLQTASVIGRRVQVQLLAGVTEESAFEEGLTDLTRHGFLDRSTEEGKDLVVFHHALVQDVAYSRLLRRRRRELHRRVAAVAESLYGAGDDVIDLLARHLFLAEAGEVAIDYLRRAGERAKRLFANEEAVLHFERALTLTPTHHGIRLELADLYELVGRYDDALRLYAVLRDETSDVQAWRGLASTYRRRGEYEEALRTLAAAFASEALRDHDLTPLSLEQGWALYLKSELQAAIDVLQDAATLARVRGLPILAQLLSHLARAEVLDDRPDEALEHAREAEQLLE